MTLTGRPSTGSFWSDEPVPEYIILPAADRDIDDQAEYYRDHGYPWEAWDLLRKSGSECVRPAYARVMREVVARRIFDLAQGGVNDRKQLAEGAVRFLNENYRHESKGPCWETIAA